MFEYVDFLQILVIAVIYIFFLLAQRVVIPANYFSVRDILYIQDKKKASLALSSRALAIVLIIWCFVWGLHWNNRDVQLGIVLGSFLNLWPSFFLYRLYIPGRSRAKLRYLVSLIISFLLTCSICRACARLLFPMMYEGLELFSLENSGFGIISSLLSFVFSGTVFKIGREINDDPYIDSVTYRYDLHLTLRKMEFEKEYIEDFSNEIQKYSEKYGIPQLLLKNVLLIERINRGTFIERWGEKLLCYCFPEFTIRQDPSIGLAQIKISTAHEVMNESKHIVITKLLDYNYSIETCAKYLAILISNYKSDCEWQMSNKIDDTKGVFMYISQRYLCGNNLTQKKFMYVYMYAISEGVSISEKLIDELRSKYKGYWVA